MTIVGRSVVADVLDDELVAGRQRVRHTRGERPRVTFVAVGTGVGKHDRRSARVTCDLGVPDDLVESFHPAVQMIGTVVQRELVGVAIDRDVPAGDAVTVAPDHGPEEIATW